MHKQGKHAGETHAREGMPWMAADALTEWAEAHRRHACCNCAYDDGCEETVTSCPHGYSPAGLRRTFRRAYRTAYRETMRARIDARAAMSKPTTSETDTEGRTMDTLTTPKHTEGPWKMRPYTKAGETEYLIDTGDGWTTAKVNATIPDEDRANAALIAAAPDLLDALREIVDHAEHYGAAPISADLMFSRARAAISKAEGRTL